MSKPVAIYKYCFIAILICISIHDIDCNEISAYKNSQNKNDIITELALLAKEVEYNSLYSVNYIEKMTSEHKIQAIKNNEYFKQTLQLLNMMLNDIFTSNYTIKEKLYLLKTIHLLRNKAINNKTIGTGNIILVNIFSKVELILLANIVGNSQQSLPKPVLLELLTIINKTKYLSVDQIKSVLENEYQIHSDDNICEWPPLLNLIFMQNDNYVQLRPNTNVDFDINATYKALFLSKKYITSYLFFSQKPDVFLLGFEILTAKKNDLYAILIKNYLQGKKINSTNYDELEKHLKAFSSFEKYLLINNATEENDIFRLYLINYSKARDIIKNKGTYYCASLKKLLK